MSLGRILLVDKPAGPTSHDVVQVARRALGERRIGHTGTLDPFASGLIVLCIGRATRLAQYLTGRPKRYRATLRLGVSTDTLDPEGRVVDTREVPTELDPERLEGALAALRGEIDQRPPAFSAKKRRGERAYEKARRGEEVELEPVRVTVHELEVTRIALPELDLVSTVSSGTYIRALGRDLGEALGTGGHLTALRRTAVGDLSVEGAIGLDELREVPPTDDHPAWRTPLEAMGDAPSIEADEEDRRHLAHGRAIAWDGAEAGLAVVRAGRELIAVGRAEAGRFHPKKVFVEAGTTG